MTTGPASRRVDAVSAESRRRILVAAEQLFAEKGFDRTSFVELSERSGISRGSISWHFQNKDGLLLAVIEQALERSEAENLTEDISLKQLILRMGASGGGPLLFMLLIEAMNTEGPIHEKYVEFFRGRRQLFQEFLVSRDVAGLPTSDRDVKAFTTVLSAAIFGLQFLSTFDPADVDLKRCLTLLTQLIESAGPA